MRTYYHTPRVSVSRWLVVVALLAGCSEAGKQSETPLEPRYGKGGQNQPPVAVISGGSHIGIPGYPVQFDATASFDPDGSNKRLSFAWDFDTNGSIDAVGPSPQHTYPAVAQYTVTLVVTDQKGATGSTTATVDIVANVPPQLQVIGDATITAGQPYYLTGLPYDVGAGPWIYTVDWGTGDQPEVTQVAHVLPLTLSKVYASPGVYPVTLMLRDPEGLQVQDAAVVTVVEAGDTYVLAGSGDITACGDVGAARTAALLEEIAGTVFTTGDNAYPNGTLAEFIDCYTPTWGRLKPRTRPSAGNHDYNTPGAGPYYAYFGEAAGAAGQGYYSYELGNWLVIVLNSSIARTATSAQVQWLRGELQNNQKPCVLAYWHHARFSSGTHGDNTSVAPFWDVLHEYGADVVLVGHDHTYERFARQTPAGLAVSDQQKGIRQFVIGTGGRSLYQFGTPKPNSEFRYNSSFGILKLALAPSGYTWEFRPVTGGVVDSGAGTCWTGA